MSNTETAVATKPVFKIQSNVALPVTARAPREQKYPFGEMNVGDSFFVAGAKSNTIHSATTRFIKADADAANNKFSIRNTKEVVEGQEELGAQEGVRVWRMADEVPAPAADAAPAAE